jgi:hypothetical protein
MLGSRARKVCSAATSAPLDPLWTVRLIAGQSCSGVEEAGALWEACVVRGSTTKTETIMTTANARSENRLVKRIKEAASPSYHANGGAGT